MITATATISQTTLRTAIGCKGVGLHSGREIVMRLCPAAPNTGVVFRRTDLRGADGEAVTVAACWRNVVDTRMATTLGNGTGATIGTVEHLMAALAGMGVDNVVVELNGPEVPVMDGSAEPFVFLIECAGIEAQDDRRRAIEILKPLTAGDGERFVAIAPGEGFSVSFDIDFDTAAIARQSFGVTLANGAFKHDLAAARTFGFRHEVEALRRAGLALGGSLDNAVVISGNTVLNKGGLRFADEFVRHKVLDCIGDLYLAGMPLIGHVHGFRSGHALNHQLLAALFADRTTWRYTDAVPAAGATAGAHRLPAWSTEYRASA